MKTSKPRRPRATRARTARSTTIKDVAREAGVSVASVSRVVNGHENVTPETRARVREVVDRLRFVPHSGARGLATRRTHVIGVLLPDLYGGYFSELIRGIDGAARKWGLHLLLSSSHGDSEEMAAAIRAMRGRVEGLLIMAPSTDASQLGEGLRAGVPAVFMNSRTPSREATSLSIDSYGGARAMTRHLIESGHRAIVHLAGPADNFDADERRRGYRDELAKRLPGTRPQIVQGDFTETTGYSAAREIAAMTPRPTAVFAANDMMAVGCLSAFGAAGIAVPGDIAVAGFDDIPLAAFVRPALTTMRARIAELGRDALTQLAVAIEATDTYAPVTQTFQPELIIRDSTTPPPGRTPWKQPVGSTARSRSSRRSR